MKLTQYETTHNAPRNPCIHLTSRFLVGISLLTIAGHVFSASEPTVIHLTQTGCQFVEPEGKNLGFETLSFDDCKQINNQTGEKRLGEVQPMILEPGKYIFRVQNKNVPYELGFWLRGSGIGRLTLPSVSGGGLTEGSSKDYLIELTEGEYVYSCPLNPTPDYPMIIKRK